MSTTLTVSDTTGIAPGALIDVGGDRMLVVAVTGCTLTVRRCPWWRWWLSRLATALRRAKWWMLCQWDRLEGGVIGVNVQGDIWWREGPMTLAWTEPRGALRERWLCGALLVIILVPRQHWWPALRAMSGR